MTRYRDDELEDDGPEPGIAMREATSPEPDDNPQRRAAAMRRAAKAALKSNPEIEANVTRQPEPIADATAVQSPEPLAELEAISERLPWQHDPEHQGPSFTTTINVPIEPTNAAELELWLASKAVKDPATGEMVHPKELRRREAKRQEAEAIERHAGEPPSGKMAFTHREVSDAEYDKARHNYEQAESHVRALQAEAQGFEGRMTDAITSQDLEAIGKLRARNRELPDLIFAAKMGAAQAEIVFMQMRAARKRLAKNEARSAAGKVNEEYLEWQRKTNDAQNAVRTAEYEASDAITAVGQAQRKLEVLRQEALSAAIGPQAHRSPMGSAHESGADTSYMRPMPQPGLERH